MHPQFQQLLWVAGLVTVTPFLFGAAAVLFDRRESAPTGEGSKVSEEKLRG